MIVKIILILLTMHLCIYIPYINKRIRNIEKVKIEGLIEREDIDIDIDIEYLTYKELKRNEKEYKNISKIKALDSLNISNLQKLDINLFLINYEMELEKIRRKLETKIIEETLF